MTDRKHLWEVRAQIKALDDLRQQQSVLGNDYLLISAKIWRLQVEERKLVNKLNDVKTRISNKEFT